MADDKAAPAPAPIVRRTFKQPGKNPEDMGRDVALNMSQAEAVTHLGGDDYMVTISGVGHRVRVKRTSATDILADKDPAKPQPEAE